MVKSKSCWWALVFVWFGSLFAFAQSSFPSAQGDQISPSDAKQAFEASKILAVKLYPAAANADSLLVRDISQLDKTAKSFGLDIFNDPYKPLLYCIMVATAQGIESDWDKLTDKEKSDVFHEIISSLQSSNTQYSATYVASIRGPLEAVPDVNAQMIKKQTEEIADLKFVIWEQKNYIQGLYNDDAAAKNALGQAQFMAWQAWQLQNREGQQQSFHVEDSDGNSAQVIVTPDN